jgi:hypothetical protein
MAKTEKLFIVEVGEDFSIMVSGPVTSCADPSGVIGSINYSFTATDSGLVQTINPYRVVLNVNGYERKPLV